MMSRRLTFWVGAAALLGCGSAGPRPAVSPSGEEPADAGAPPGVAAEAQATTASLGSGWDGSADLRLGCTVVPAADLAEAAARGGLDAPDIEPAVRTAALADLAGALVRRALADREIRRLHLELQPDEIDRALQRLVETNFEGDEERFEAQLAEQGMSLEAYRSLLADQLAEFKAMAILFPVGPRDDEVEQEYRRRIDGADQADVRPFEEVREEIFRDLLEERLEERWLNHLARLRVQLEALPTHKEDGTCVEDWPTHDVSDIRFEGNAALTDAELRHAVESLVGPGGGFLVEGLAAPASFRAAVAALYYDRSYLEARVEMDVTVDGQVILRIEEGEPHRLGDVQLVVRAPDGTESPDELGEATWRPWLGMDCGAPFARDRFGRFLERLSEEYARRWGMERVDVEPDVETHDGVVDVRVTILRPAAS
ncbi:MAG: hypothetical protein GYA57_09515 [Myxococcales bacterium]|nr:hypothetical protein [Myxococcales bacterium]